MANGWGNHGGRGGWGGSGSDVDHRPGNEWESPQYSRTFDPRSEQEYTATFLETPDQLRKVSIQEAQARREAEMREAMREAQSRVHFWPSVGKFIIPRANTWAAHAYLVEHKEHNLYFNPEKYLYFDKIIAEKFPGILKPENETMRKNLAVLRNDVIGIYLKDGSFDPGDEVHVPKLMEIATTIGEALANDNVFKRPFTRSFSRAVANVEGIGAEQLYQFLLDSQEKPGLFSTLTHNIKTLLKIDSRLWNLPPIEQTPFSPENMSAPLPPLSQIESADQIVQGRFTERLRNERGQGPAPSLA